jgi:hypothetical protein
MASPPKFPKAGNLRDKYGSQTSSRRDAAGGDDVAQLRNQIQSFCDRHDGEAGYESACQALRQAHAELGQISGGKREKPDTPGRKSAMAAQQGPVAA